MALGTALGIGASVIGGALSGSSQKKAANKAADATVQAAESNNALAREIYGKNQAFLSPYMQTGQTAGNYLNAFLGLPGQSSGTGGQADWGAYLQQNPDVAAGYNQTADKSRFTTPEQYAQWHYGQYGQGEGRQMPTGTVTAPVTQGDAQNAFGSYLKNSDYGFQFATGSNALNSGYAGAGALQSGAAMKGLEQYRQNLQSGYRNEYLGNLGNQQSVGLAAGSALAGVGQNYVNTISGNNNSAANATGNAALVAGQNNPFANALGTLGGALIGVGRK